MVPYSRNEGFIAGDQNLSCIREKQAERKPGHHRRLAIYGLGGVGYSNTPWGRKRRDLLTRHRKTQDVLEYIYTLKDSPVSVFWVHAGSRARFEQDYRKLAKLVELPGCDEPKEDIRPVVKDWLESPKSGDWILVVDNADNKRRFLP